MTFTELLRNVGLFGAAVMCCLVALSVFSVAVIVDKQRRFRLAASQSEIFKPMFTKFLHGGELQELIEALQQHPNSHVEMNRASSQLVNRLFKVPSLNVPEMEESEVAHAAR